VQVRWNYKLQPNKGQAALMSEWLVTLRKHRNYSLRERIEGYQNNNLDSEEIICYQYGSYCEIDTHQEFGSFCPLTCAVVKHGVLSSSLTKTAKDVVVWGSASDVQSKRTSELRTENPWYKRIYSGVLQGNLAKLDAAYSGFFKNNRGFPAFRTASNFKTFQYKPGQAKFNVNRESSKSRCYSHMTLPGLGTMRYLDSREIPNDAEIRTVTVKKEVDGWYISVLLNTKDALPEVANLEDCQSSVGIDVGINKLVSLSDGSFVENRKFSTNKATRRRLKIRQRRVNRKKKGSKNRSKAGIAVAKLHKKIADGRDDYNWKAAQKIVDTADAVVREDLNIPAMKKRAKPKKLKGRFVPNGQSAKRGLNRSISDATWGDLFSKIAWLAAKSGKPVLTVNPKFTSQECSSCGHYSKDNRDGEKFICEECGHIDHADTQASRTINRRSGLIFDSKVVKIGRTHPKCLPADCGKVTPFIESASNGERSQVRNCISKAMPEKQISEQLSLFRESPCL
jgi:putative transposase